MIKRLVLSLIRLYQSTVSPDHGIVSSCYPHGYCRYYPSCSEYTHLSIERHGVAKGIAHGAFRVIRCNPWSEGGIDLPS